MMDALAHSFSLYYGMDWLSLLTGLYGTYLITNKSRSGFVINGVGCILAFGVSVVSYQYGFVVYNAILFALMVRGYVLWGRAPVVTGA